MRASLTGLLNQRFEFTDTTGRETWPARKLDGLYVLVLIDSCGRGWPAYP